MKAPKRVAFIKSGRRIIRIKVTGYDPLRPARPRRSASQRDMEACCMKNVEKLVEKWRRQAQGVIEGEVDVDLDHFRYQQGRVSAFDAVLAAIAADRDDVQTPEDMWDAHDAIEADREGRQEPFATLEAQLRLAIGCRFAEREPHHGAWAEPMRVVKEVLQSKLAAQPIPEMARKMTDAHREFIERIARAIVNASTDPKQRFEWRDALERTLLPLLEAGHRLAYDGHSIEAKEAWDAALGKLTK